MKYKKNQHGKIAILHETLLKGIPIEWQSPLELEGKINTALVILHTQGVHVSIIELYDFLYSQLLNNSDSIKIAISATLTASLLLFKTQTQLLTYVNPQLQLF